MSGVSTRPDRPRKYRNVPTVVDGIRFDSKAEARRYSELLMLQRCGEIRNILRQPGFDLAAHNPTGDLPFKVGMYLADFAYERVSDGQRIFEDVKGIDTPLSKWKRKHVKAQYGIDVQLVR